MVQSKTGFDYLVELGDKALDAMRWEDAAHWYALAVEHLPPGIDAQQLETVQAFLGRVRELTGVALARGLRAACAVVRA
jgi:hypothetical protein